MESKLPAMATGKGEVVETAKQITDLPSFHFQKLRVLKPVRKYMTLITADGS